MANELTVAARITFNGSDTVPDAFSTPSFAFNVNQTGGDITSGTQNIGTTAEAIDKGSITTAGWILVKNLDATNYITLGTSGSLAARLNAGEVALFRLSGDPFAQANTAAVNIQYWLFED